MSAMQYPETTAAIAYWLTQQRRLEDRHPEPKADPPPYRERAPRKPAPPRVTFRDTEFTHRLSVWLGTAWIGDVARYVTGWRCYDPDGERVGGLYDDRHQAAQALRVRG